MLLSLLFFEFIWGLMDWSATHSFERTLS